MSSAGSDDERSVGRSQQSAQKRLKTDSTGSYWRLHTEVSVQVQPAAEPRPRWPAAINWTNQNPELLEKFKGSVLAGGSDPDRLLMIWSHTTCDSVDEGVKVTRLSIIIL